MSTEKSYGQMMESLGHLHATTKSMHETVTAAHKALQDLHARHEALHARHEALHERHESLHKSLQDLHAEHKALHAKVEALKSLTDPDNDGDVHPSGDYTPSPMVHNNASPPPAADWTQLTSVLRELAENQKRTSDAFYALTGR